MSDPIEEQEEFSPTDDPVSDGGQEKIGILSTPTKNEIVLSHTNLNVSNSPKITAETFNEYSSSKLKSTFFSGKYEDRVYVESLGGYRDRVIVDDDEIRFLRHLKSVLKRGKRFQGEAFQGISKHNEDEEKICILVSWSTVIESPALGHYWFIVDNIIFPPKGGLEFSLKLLREKEALISVKTCPKCGASLDQTSESSVSCAENSDLSLNELARECQSKFISVFGQPSEWWENAKPHLSISNVIKLFKLIVLLLVALVTGIGTFVQTLVPKVNKTIFALSHFLGQSMPFLLACLDTINKVIGGLFLLFTMMWKDMIYGKNASPNSIPQGLQQPKSQLSLQHSSKSTKFPTIERGENNPYKRTPRYPYLRNEVQRPYHKSPSPT